MTKIFWVTFLLITLSLSIYGEEYRYKKPKLNTIPDSLKSDRWYNHLKNELLPFWTTTSAIGTPPGNYPTNRRNDGQEFKGDRSRYPRMIGRQIYAYSIGYLITGDEKLLQYAKYGIDWLTKYGKDYKNGGWHQVLDKNGNYTGNNDKYSQDLAYVAIGFASYYFVTRDLEAEKELLEIRDLIFSKYWDEKNKRVIDGFDFYMEKELDQDEGGWELVAQLDQINGYLMLSQPVLSEQSRREEFLNDIKRLSQTIVNKFYKNGIFWGQSEEIGSYGTRHVDYGHTLKSYWMILEGEKRGKWGIFNEELDKNMKEKIKEAYKERENGEGIWTEEMYGDGRVDKSPASWWVYAECDQLAATLDFNGEITINMLEKTAKTWDKYVDKKNYEVYTSYGIGDKAGEWKNGFHSIEHAAVMYIHGKYLEKKEIPLYFAVTENQIKSFAAVPYIFNGKEVNREELNKIIINNKEFVKVKVDFDEIY